MNTNDLTSIMSDTIRETKDGIGKSVEWVISQTPELCEQYLKIEMVKSCTSAALLLAGAIVVAYACYRAIKWGSAKRGGISEHPELVILLFPAVGAIVAIVSSYNYAMVAATIYIAPKVYLVEFAATLLKR